MRVSRFIGAILALAIVVAAGCDNDKKNPIAPSGVEPYLGDWSGTITSTRAGEGTLQLSLDHLDFQLLGTWATTFPDASFNQQGTASGLQTQDGVTLTLTPNAPVSCPNAPDLVGTMVMIVQLDHGHLVADYGAIDCDASKGHLDLVRR
jgi:hypothetical protein